MPRRAELRDLDAMAGGRSAAAAVCLLQERNKEDYKSTARREPLKPSQSWKKKWEGLPGRDECPGVEWRGKKFGTNWRSYTAARRGQIPLCGFGARDPCNVHVHVPCDCLATYPLRKFHPTFTCPVLALTPTSPSPFLPLQTLHKPPKSVARVSFPRTETMNYGLPPPG